MDDAVRGSGEGRRGALRPESRPQLGRLDSGERALWGHALGRSAGRILCGPNIASIRLGVGAGHGDRLVSLEELLEKAGLRPKGGPTGPRQDVARLFERTV